MGKLLLLGLLVLLLLWWLPRMRRASRRDAPPVEQPGDGALQDMVRCAHCGLHLPQREAHVRDKLSYCSPEHAAARDGDA